MPKVKKRPSKNAKAVQRLLTGSKLLSDKSEREKQSEREYGSSVVTPRTNTTALKPRPHKKRG